MDWSRKLQSSPDSMSGPRRTGARQGALLHPADRRMLQAVRDTLSHVSRPVTSTSPRHDVEMLPQSQNNWQTSQNWSYMTGESLTSGGSGGGAQNCSRLHYNKKAMDEIRQSLENYHVTPSCDSNSTVLPAATTTHLTNGTTASDNMVRQVVLLGANEVCSSSSTEFY